MALPYTYCPRDWLPPRTVPHGADTVYASMSPEQHAQTVIDAVQRLEELCQDPDPVATPSPEVMHGAARIWVDVLNGDDPGLAFCMLLHLLDPHVGGGPEPWKWVREFAVGRCKPFIDKSKPR